jgi:glutathione synthase/RimK-type ligase-like ATP-grasp enzyme
MKQIVFLGSHDADGKNDVATLAQSLVSKLEDTTVRVCYWEDLLFTIADEGRSVVDSPSGFDMAAADLVIAMNWYRTGSKSFYRDMAFTLALYLEQAGVSFWNSEMLYQRSTTKLSALMQLSLQGMPVPRTVFSLAHASLIEADIPYPRIVKTIVGSRGAQNYLANDGEELVGILERDKDTPFMIEEFIPNDHDLRIVCYAGKPSLVIKRSRMGSATHLNNTSQGADATLMPLNEVAPAVLRAARAACRILGREMAGVDILLANDGSKRMVCLEVNAIPQLTSGSYQSEKANHLAAALEDFTKGMK